MRPLRLLKDAVISLYTNVRHCKQRIRHRRDRVLRSRNVSASAVGLPCRDLRLDRFVIMSSNVRHRMCPDAGLVNVHHRLAGIICKITYDDADTVLKHASMCNVDSIASNLSTALRILNEYRRFS